MFTTTSYQIQNYPDESLQSVLKLFKRCIMLQSMVMLLFITFLLNEWITEETIDKTPLPKFQVHSKDLSFNVRSKEFLVIMLEQTLTGNPEQEVVNFLQENTHYLEMQKSTIVATSPTEANMLVASKAAEGKF
ncbi:hypothetical protein Tco_1419027 [Tanacetum coccineum]